MIRFPRLSPSVFALCKQSKTGCVEGLGMKLHNLHIYTCSQKIINLNMILCIHTYMHTLLSNQLTMDVCVSGKVTRVSRQRTNSVLLIISPPLGLYKLSTHLLSSACYQGFSHSGRLAPLKMYGELQWNMGPHSTVHIPLFLGV